MIGRISALFVALALVAAACGGGESDVAESTAVETTQPSQTTEPPSIQDPSQTPTETVATEAPTESVPPPSGNLRFGMLIPLATWNPHAEPREIMNAMYDSVYDTLIRFDNDLQLLPDLATEWTVTPEAVELTLRDDVVFHDGTPFDADAVKFNIEHAKSIPGEAAAALAAVESVDVIDATRVRLNLSSPAPQLIWKLAQAPGMMISPAAAATIDVTPVGTGPWMYDEDASGPGKWVVTAFPDYRNPADQGFETITYIFAGDAAARLNGIQGGELDVVFVQGTEIPAYEDAGLEVAGAPGLMFALNFLDRGPGGVFEDVRVRQAISHAIDREQVFLPEDGGIARTVRYASSEYGGSADSEGFPYNPDRARELLAEAGVTDLSFTMPSDFVFNESNQIIQQLLAAVGVDMQIEEIGIGQIIVECVSGKYEACFLPVVDFHPASFWLDYVAPSSDLNPGEWPSPAATAVEAAFAEPDFAAAEPLWAEAMATIADDVPYAFLNLVANNLAYDAEILETIEPVYFTPNAIRLDGLRFIED